MCCLMVWSIVYDTRKELNTKTTISLTKKMHFLIDISGSFFIWVFFLDGRELHILKANTSLSLDEIQAESQNEQQCITTFSILLIFRCFIFQQLSVPDEKSSNIFKVNERKTSLLITCWLLMSCKDSIMHQTIILFILMGKK